MLTLRCVSLEETSATADEQGVARKHQRRRTRVLRVSHVKQHVAPRVAWGMQRADRQGAEAIFFFVLESERHLGWVAGRMIVASE